MLGYHDNMLHVYLQAQIRDYLGRLIYCAMLGYHDDVAFGQIEAIKLAQRGTGWDKRMGYLASSLLLHEDHELVILLTATIHKVYTLQGLTLIYTSLHF
jgi:hypothetical protein